MVTACGWMREYWRVLVSGTRYLFCFAEGKKLSELHKLADSFDKTRFLIFLKPAVFGKHKKFHFYFTSHLLVLQSRFPFKEKHLAFPTSGT